MATATFNEPFAVSPYRGPYGGMHGGGPAVSKKWKPAAGRKASISLHVYDVQNAFLASGRALSPLQGFPGKGGGARGGGSGTPSLDVWEAQGGTFRV